MDYYGDDPDAAAESDSSTKEQEEEYVNFAIPNIKNIVK